MTFKLWFSKELLNGAPDAFSDRPVRCNAKSLPSAASLAANVWEWRDKGAYISLIQQKPFHETGLSRKNTATLAGVGAKAKLMSAVGPVLTVSDPLRCRAVTVTHKTLLKALHCRHVSVMAASLTGISRITLNFILFFFFFPANGSVSHDLKSRVKLQWTVKSSSNIFFFLFFPCLSKRLKWWNALSG